MVSDIKSKKKQVTFDCTESTRNEICVSGKKKLPNIYFFPREKSSYLCSVSRQFKGRTLRQKRKDELATKLPNLPKRVRYVAKSRNSQAHFACKPVLTSSSVKKFNMCLPKVAENQIYFDKNGRIVVRKTKKKPAVEKTIDIFNLPPITSNLELTKQFDKTPKVNKLTRNVRVSLLKLSDLDMIFDRITRPQHFASNSIDLCNQVYLSPDPYNSTFSPIRIIPLATTEYLNQLWYHKCKEFKNYTSLTSQNHKPSKEYFEWHVKPPNYVSNQFTGFLDSPLTRWNHIIKPSDSTLYLSEQ